MAKMCPVLWTSLQGVASSASGRRLILATLAITLALQLANWALWALVVFQVLEDHRSALQTVAGSMARRALHGTSGFASTPLHLAKALSAWAILYVMAGPALPVRSTMIPTKVKVLSQLIWAPSMFKSAPSEAGVLDQWVFSAPMPRPMSLSCWTTSAPSAGDGLVSGRLR